jgi:hypothetical protein
MRTDPHVGPGQHRPAEKFVHGVSPGANSAILSLVQTFFAT